MFRKKRAEYLLLAAGVLLSGVLLLYDPAYASGVFYSGLRSLIKVLPSVFPFLVLSGLLFKSGLAMLVGERAGGAFSRLFRLPPAAFGAAAAGLICGFPVGARCTADLYLSGECGKRDAERLAAFCNFASPAFLLGTVGAGVLGSVRAGLALYTLQTVFALLFGFFYKRPKKRAVKEVCVPRNGFTEERLSASLVPEAIGEAAAQTLRICGFILFFSLLAGVFTRLFPEAVAGSPWFEPFFYGFFEFSSGCVRIPAGHGNAFAAAALITGFSGVSVLTQCASFLSEHGVSLKGYLIAHTLCPLFTAFFGTMLERACFF